LMRRASAAAVALVALAAPAGAPAHWIPRSFTEHYRFVAAPANEPPTPPPTGAHARLGPGRAVSVESGERGAQIVVYLPPGALRAAPGPVAFRVTPLAPARGGAWTVVGNVYRLSAAGTRGVRPGALNEIRLRAPYPTGVAPVVARRNGGGWRPLITRVHSGGMYAAPLDALGDYALVVPAPKAGRRAGRTPVLAVVPAALLVALLGLGARAGRSAYRR
jgi:hypothetical protein